MLSFSIIVCTYNPDLEILQRLLNALLKFDHSTIEHEMIIVDNKSLPALQQSAIVNSFLSEKRNAVVVYEAKPGLTSARVSGIAKAKHDVIIFFDDDNEPPANYLAEALKILTEYPEIGALGPGIIKVEYPDKFYESKFGHIKELFQERSVKEISLSNEKWWQTCYPPGTGLIIRKDVAKTYARNVEQGNYSLTDRKGKLLTSGGDLQIVLTAIRTNYSAGVHPALCIKHIIGKSRLSVKYLKRLSFGTAAANVPGHIQVWGLNTTDQFKVPLSGDIFRQIYYHVKVKRVRDGLLKAQLSLCSYLGACAGLYEINPEVRPSIWWRLMCKILKVN